MKSLASIAQTHLRSKSRMQNYLQALSFIATRHYEELQRWHIVKQVIPFDEFTCSKAIASTDDDQCVGDGPYRT